jgi:glycosyltransferase involved in cell wall biosynthesis
VTTTIVIPAHNEAANIGRVLGAVAATSLDTVVIVDACTDETAAVARSWGARVIEISAGDKGTAMAAGLAVAGGDDTLFIDADLEGLLPQHVAALATAEPAAGMVVGLRQSSPFGGLPPISGERRIPTLFGRGLRLAGLGYRTELAIDAAVARAGLPHRHYTMAGVSNPTREWRHPLMLLDLGFYALWELPALALYVEQSIRG